MGNGNATDKMYIYLYVNKKNGVLIYATKLKILFVLCLLVIKILILLTTNLRKQNKEFTSLH